MRAKTMRKNLTTILITRTTRKKLGEIGKKDETYDDVINVLITAYKEGLTTADLRREARQ